MREQYDYMQDPVEDDCLSEDKSFSEFCNYIFETKPKEISFNSPNNESLIYRIYKPRKKKSQEASKNAD